MNNQTEYRTMIQKKTNRTLKEIKAIMGEDDEFLRPMVREVIQEFLEAEMAEAIGAENGARVEGRLSYRSGYYPQLGDSSRQARADPAAAGPRIATDDFPPRSSSATSAARRPWWRRSPRCPSKASQRARSKRSAKSWAVRHEAARRRV